MMKRLYPLVVCILLATVVAHAQDGKKRKKPANFNKQNKENDRFLEKQWWLGVKAGGNLSDPVVDKTYSIIKATNYDQQSVKKQYDSYKLLGSQVTIEVTFYFRGICFSLQPTYRHSRFAYVNNYSWTSSDPERPDDRLDLVLDQEQAIDYIDLPFVVKYELTNNKVRPYLQAGAYSSFLVNANKSVDRSGVDYASGGTNEFHDETISIGAKDLFAKNQWGLLAGAGLNYNVGNVRLNLDIQYKLGMSNITSTKNRYSSDRLSGVGDAMDDIKLNNLSVSLGCLFPLRFLSSGFKSVDK